MHNILVAGAGKIGCLIATLLQASGDYQVRVVDLQFEGADAKRTAQHVSGIVWDKLDVSSEQALAEFIRNHEIKAVISCLPYFCNVSVASVAKACACHYFDLTEDVSVTEAIKKLANGAESSFVPQCGLAPGLISIAANSLMGRFEKVDTVKLRVGALPQHTSNALHYALTWSTDGLINEYGNPCYGIVNGENTVLTPLDGMEHIVLDGSSYEAFNTSGGLGSLAEIHQGKVHDMTYKTIRYPGHCEKMRMLMVDLRMNEHRDTLKHILENAVAKTPQDVVVIYVSVSGLQQGQYIEENWTRKVYPTEVANLEWSAIQITTAAGLCTVVDLLFAGDPQHGFIYQENFTLDAFLNNRFGQYYN